MEVGWAVKAGQKRDEQGLGGGGGEGVLGTQQIVLQKSSKYWANSFTFECYACKSRQKIIIVISPG